MFAFRTVCMFGMIHQSGRKSDPVLVTIYAMIRFAEEDLWGNFNVDTTFALKKQSTFPRNNIEGREGGYAQRSFEGAALHSQALSIFYTV